MDANKTQLEQYCIIRCRNAGVHAGVLIEHDRANNVVRLRDSRRLWRWFGRTLSGLALEGTPDKSKCKFGPEISDIYLLDPCEIIPCTEDAESSLRGVEDWVNE